MSLPFDIVIAEVCEYECLNHLAYNNHWRPIAIPISRQKTPATIDDLFAIIQTTMINKQTERLFMHKKLNEFF